MFYIYIYLCLYLYLPVCYLSGLFNDFEFFFDPFDLLTLKLFYVLILAHMSWLLNICSGFGFNYTV